MTLVLGPSVQLAFLATETVVELSVRSLQWVWEECAGVARGGRRISQLEAQGWIQLSAHRDPLARVVRLTEAGRLAALGGRDLERQWQRPWDGRWRVVLFDVPEHREAARASLRRMLRQHHFGYLQNSAWISPDGLDSLGIALADLGADAETLTLMEGRPCGGETDRDLVTGAWDFVRINQSYAAHDALLRDPPKGSLRSPGRRDAWHQWLRVEWRAWQRVLRQDPLLPQALLPPGYLGQEVWKRRARLLRDLPLTLPV